MKEVWFYLIHLFGDSQRHAKAIRKARDTDEYEGRGGGVPGAGAVARAAAGVVRP